MPCSPRSSCSARRMRSMRSSSSGCAPISCGGRDEPPKEPLHEGAMSAAKSPPKSHSNVAAVVLAAGMGKRMHSDLAKVLNPMAGRPLLGHVLDTLEALGVGRTVVVIGYQKERVQAAFAGEPGIEWAVQAEQRGTGHACMMAEPLLRGFG